MRRSSPSLGKHRLLCVPGIPPAPDQKSSFRRTFQLYSVRSLVLKFGWNWSKTLFPHSPRLHRSPFPSLAVRAPPPPSIRPRALRPCTFRLLFEKSKLFFLDWPNLTHFHRARGRILVRSAQTPGSNSRLLFAEAGRSATPSSLLQGSQTLIFTQGKNNTYCEWGIGVSVPQLGTAPYILTFHRLTTPIWNGFRTF